MNAIVFRVCGVLEFLSCNAEAIVIVDTDLEGGTIIGGRSIPFGSMQMYNTSETFGGES